jgi:hypothetical protein
MPLFSTKGLDAAIEEARRKNLHVLQSDLTQQYVYRLCIKSTQSLIISRKKSLYMAARNERVKHGLQVAYAEQFKGNSLNVFCISNSLYKKQHGDIQGESNRVLVDSSGIRDLRKFCYSMAAEARFDDAKHFLRVSLPGILNAISLRSGREVFPGATKPSVSLDLTNILGFENKVGTCLF